MASPHVIRGPRPVRTVACERLHRLSCVKTAILRRSTVFPIHGRKVPVGVGGAGEPRSGNAFVIRDAYGGPGFAVANVTNGGKFYSVGVRGSVVGDRINFKHGMLRMFRSRKVDFRRIPSKVSAVAMCMRRSRFRRGRRRMVTKVRHTMRPSFMRVRSSLTLVTIMKHNVGSAENATKEVFSTLTRTGMGIGVVSRNSDRLGVVVNMRGESFRATMGTVCSVFMVARVWLEVTKTPSRQDGL